VTDWATEALLAGVDSPTLPILAGLTLLTSPFEVDHYLDAVLDELSVRREDDDTVVRRYAADLARKVVDGELSPARGLREIAPLAVGLGYPDELYVWMQLEDQYLMEEAYRPATLHELDEAVRLEAAALAARWKER
jgi:hypothetical protein